MFYDLSESSINAVVTHFSSCSLNHPQKIFMQEEEMMAYFPVLFVLFCLLLTKGKSIHSKLPLSQMLG